MLALGVVPESASLTLTPGQAFRCRMQALAADEVTPVAWPAATNATITFGGGASMWVATPDLGDPSMLVFAASSTVVDAVVSAGVSTMRLIIDGTRIGAGCVRIVRDGQG